MEAAASYQAAVPYATVRPYAKLISPAQTYPFSSQEAHPREQPWADLNAFPVYPGTAESGN